VVPDERKKVFFFEKKNQKTFALWRSRPSSPWSADAEWQKFFGSFFQKRTLFSSSQAAISSVADCLLHGAG
jgi:hypothetical protein